MHHQLFSKNCQNYFSKILILLLVLMQNNSKVFTQSTNIQILNQNQDAIGIKLFIISTIIAIITIMNMPCIFYNQKTSIIWQSRIEEAQKICFQFNSSKNNSYLQNKLIYTSGITNTLNQIKDNLSQIGGKNLIKIIRKVQVLEWRKKVTKNAAGDHEYQQLEWASENSLIQGNKINSLSDWLFQSQTIYNNDVFLQNFKLNQQILSLCKSKKQITLTEETAKNILKHYNLERDFEIVGRYIYFFKRQNKTTNILNFNHIEESLIQKNKEKKDFKIPGTLRVQIICITTGPISLIARYTGQQNKNFVPFSVSHLQQQILIQQNDIKGCFCNKITQKYQTIAKAPQTILCVQQKLITKKQMFKKQQRVQLKVSFSLRILGFSYMVFLLSFLLFPLAHFLGYLPLIQSLIEGFTWKAIIHAAFLLSLPAYLLIVSIAWLKYGRKKGLFLLTLALGMSGFYTLS